MRRDRQEIKVRRDERGRQRAPRPHLPDAEEARDGEGSESDPQMRQRKSSRLLTGDPPIGVRAKAFAWHDADGRPHLAVTNPQNSWQGINRSPVLVKTV